MKNIIMILIVVFTINSINGQTNRYTEITPSTYKPVSNSNYSQGSTEAAAIRRFKNIHNSIDYYQSKIKVHLDNITDTHFLNQMKLIQFDINFLLSSEMSLNRAESYIKDIAKRYNKAVKDYNKKVRKHNKELDKKQKKSKKN